MPINNHSDGAGAGRFAVRELLFDLFQCYTECINVYKYEKFNWQMEFSIVDLCFCFVLSFERFSNDVATNHHFRPSKYFSTQRQFCLSSVNSIYYYYFFFYIYEHFQQNRRLCQRVYTPIVWLRQSNVKHFENRFGESKKQEKKREWKWKCIYVYKEKTKMKKPEKCANNFERRRSYLFELKWIRVECPFTSAIACHSLLSYLINVCVISYLMLLLLEVVFISNFLSLSISVRVCVDAFLKLNLTLSLAFYLIHIKKKRRKAMKHR